jgi:hypothetical protein
MIQGYRLAGKGFPPKAQGHVSQPVQLKSKAKNSNRWNGIRVASERYCAAQQYCSINVASGQFLPRHLTERAAALPHEAAAPNIRHRDSYGPEPGPDLVRAIERG